MYRHAEQVWLPAMVMGVESKRGFRITTGLDGYQRPLSVPALNEQPSAVVVGDLRQSITQRSVVCLSHG